MLNKEEIKRYHEDGYIIPEFKMSENDLLEIEKLHDELIKKNPQFLNYCPAVLEYEEKFLKYCFNERILNYVGQLICLLYTSPSPRDNRVSRMPSSA